MSPRSLRIAAALVAVTMVATIFPALANAAPPDSWGYAVVRRAKAASYTLPDKDRWSNPAGLVKSQRTAKGRYVVHFDGLTMEGGNVQVTPLSAAGDLCTIIEWDGGILGLDVHVRCYGRGGARKDVRFIVNAIESFNQDVGPQTAYLWANDPVSPAYTPTAGYNFSTAGTRGAITRASTGRYFVRFADIEDPAGNVQVSAYGPGRHTCRIASWRQDVKDHVGQVICRDRRGAPVDSRFSYLFTNGEGMKGAWGGPYAYLVANKPRRAKYIPKSLYRSADPATTPRVKRVGKGRYVVKLPSMPHGGSVQVTPMGEGAKRCNVTSIRTSGSPQRIGVQCTKVNGRTPADSRFSLSYLR